MEISQQTLRMRLMHDWVSLFPHTSLERAHEMFDRVWKLYTQRHRKYHGISHIDIGLQAMSRLFPNAPREAVIAFWLHDAIYVPGRHDNEFLASRLSEFIVAYLGEDESTTRTIGAAVQTTAWHTPTTSIEMIVCDIDLLSLGLPANEYDVNTRKIRDEYLVWNDAVWLAGRVAFIERFLARPTIYHLPRTQELYEQAARLNLTRELGYYQAR